MVRFVRWLRGNAEGVLALLIAITIGALHLFDVFNDALSPQVIGGATLLVLALIAVTLLRDRNTAAKAYKETSAVRMLYGHEVGQAHAEARRGTEQWIFKGGTGTYLRAVTLPECVANARREKRPLRVQLEIIDPTDEELCKTYAQFRSSLTPGPDGTGEPWTLERTRRESFATVLAACWYRQRFTFLTVEAGLSKTMTTFRWDQSSRCVIMTQEDPAGPALLFELGKPYYQAYSRELVASFKQARHVRIDKADELHLSDEPTVDEVRKLFVGLGMELPRSFTDRDVSDLIRRALQARNPYQ